MILAVGYINDARAIDQYPVRPRQPAEASCAVGTVAARTVAHHGLDDPAVGVDPPNRVALGIGNIDAAVRRDGDPLRTRKLRFNGRAAVAGVPVRPGARDVVDGAPAHIDAIHRVAFAQHQVHVAARIERHRARAVQWSAVQRRAVRRGLTLSGPGERSDQPGLQIHPPNAPIADVGNVQRFAARVERDAVRLPQLRLRRRTSVARKSRHPGPGQRRNDSRLTVHAPHHVIRHLGEIHVPRRIEKNLVRLIQRRLDRRPAVARVAFLPVASHRREPAGLQIHTPHHVAVHFANVQRAVRPEGHAVGIIQLCGRRRSAIARMSRFAGSGDRPDIGRPRAGQPDRQRHANSGRHTAPHADASFRAIAVNAPANRAIMAGSTAAAPRSSGL